MFSINCTLPIRLYLLTFTIVLPVICFVLQLHQSVFYQLLTRLTVFVKPDMMSQMDNDLLSELFTMNSERLDSANRFLELQQRSVVTQNVSTLPVKYQINLYSEVDADVTQKAPLWLQRKNTDTTITVSIAVISAGRDSVVSSGQQFAPCYLTQNVARFIALISGQGHYTDQVSYQLIVCSVGEHITAEEHSLSRLVRLIRDPKLDSGSTFGPFHDQLAWRYEKEKRDYTYCLRQAAQGVKFVLMVEDDALPLNESLSVISRLVTGHWTDRPDSHTVGERFYVKLYHPVHLQNYVSLEVEPLSQLFAAAIVLGSCLYLVVSRCGCIKTDDRTSTLKHMSWIQCCIYCGLIVPCIGQAYIHSWRRLLAPYAHCLISDKFCCTQAILYTAQTARDLAAYLDNTSCNETYHKDDALWRFTTVGYLIQPNVFEHVGVWSTVRRGFVDPHTIN